MSLLSGPTCSLAGNSDHKTHRDEHRDQAEEQRGRVERSLHSVRDAPSDDWEAGHRVGALPAVGVGGRRLAGNVVGGLQDVVAGQRNDVVDLGLLGHVGRHRVCHDRVVGDVGHERVADVLRGLVAVDLLKQRMVAIRAVRLHGSIDGDAGPVGVYDAGTAVVHAGTRRADVVVTATIHAADGVVADASACPCSRHVHGGDEGRGHALNRLVQVGLNDTLVAGSVVGLVGLVRSDRLGVTHASGTPVAGSERCDRLVGGVAVDLVDSVIALGQVALVRGVDCQGVGRSGWRTVSPGDRCHVLSGSVQVGLVDRTAIVVRSVGLRCLVDGAGACRIDQRIGSMSGRGLRLGQRLCDNLLGGIVDVGLVDTSVPRSGVGLRCLIDGARGGVSLVRGGTVVGEGTYDGRHADGSQDGDERSKDRDGPCTETLRHPSSSCEG
jgi:hypothetical protein